MTRRLRSLSQHGWFHLTNRGVDRQDIFATDLDRRIFLDEVGRAAAECGVEVHAYCLMTTHFHLIVHCPDGALSLFVQTLSRRYAEGFNAWVAREGPLFTGRFTSTALHSDDDGSHEQRDPDAALKMSVRYVHRNPLDFLPLRAVRAYVYSSYPVYLGHRAPPPWLHTDVVSAVCGGPDRIERFTETPMVSDSTPPTGHAGPTWSPSEVISAVACAAGADAERVRVGTRGVRNDARLVAVRLCVSLRTATSAALALEFAVTTQQGLRQLAARGKQLIATDPAAGALSRRALARLWAAADAG